MVSSVGQFRSAPGVPRCLASSTGCFSHRTLAHLLYSSHVPSLLPLQLLIINSGPSLLPLATVPAQEWQVRSMRNTGAVRDGVGQELGSICVLSAPMQLSADCSTYARIAHHSIMVVEIRNLSSRLGEKLCNLPTGSTAVHYLSVDEAGSDT